MRSCEYLKVPNHEDKKTKRLCVRNFRFSIDDRNISVASREILNANKISITFEDQKNRTKVETVTLYSTNDEVICPVKSWSKTIFRIMQLENGTLDTPVNTFMNGNQRSEFTSADMISTLRDSVKTLGKDKLGFAPSEVGTHSLRSGGAMAMCLAQVDPYRIKLIGRWKSDSFMRYIRKQIEEFTKDISNRMIENEHFTHVPTFTPTQN